MPTFEISIAFQTNKSPARYRELAKLVNQYPFSRVSAYNDLSFQPALGPLLLMAGDVKTAQLGPACVNPFTVHPVEIAGQMAVLDLVTEGRAYLGIARGAWLDALGLDPPNAITAIREAIQIVQQLLAGERRAFEGRVFHLDPAYALSYPVYRPRIPIMVGTWGAKLAEVAGELADEIKVSPTANAFAATHLRGAIAVGAQRVGRAPESVRLVLGGMCVIDREREQARRLARREVSRYLPVVAPLDPTFEIDPDWFDRLRVASKRGDWDSAASLISDDILDRFTYSGDAHDLLRLLERARAGGISRVDLGTPHGLDEAEGIRLLGEKVLPHFSQE